MPDFLAIIHHNACEYLSNLLHETVIAGTIQTNRVPPWGSTIPVHNYQRARGTRRIRYLLLQQCFLLRASG